MLDDNSTIRWMIFICLTLISVVLANIIYKTLLKFLKKITKNTENKLDDVLIDTLRGPLEFALILLGTWFAHKILHLSPTAETDIRNAFYALIIIDIAWFLSRLVNLSIKKYLIPIAKRNDTIIDTEVLEILVPVLKIFIWVTTIIVIVKIEGFNPVSLIAGVGIGGLALIFSSKNIKKFLQNLSLFTSKPFEVGERVIINGQDGTIEKMNIKRVYLRLRNGRLLVMPLGHVLNGTIEKVDTEPSRKIVLEVGLSHFSDEAQIKRAMEIMQEIVNESDVLEDNTKIVISTINHYAIIIQFTYYIKKEANIYDTQTQTTLEVYTRFKKENFELA
jgi:MscS family membrane protein